MEGVSTNSSERARKLFERVVDIVTNDYKHERPNSQPMMHTPQRSDCDPDPCTSRMLYGDRRRTTALQTGVHCGSGSGSSAATDRRLLSSSNAIPEHNRLFGYQTKRKDHRKDPKKCKGRSTPTWVHDCICLAVPDQEWLPTPHDKMELASWGLGLKRLSFARDASPAEIEAVVYASFPKLSGRYDGPAPITKL